MVATSGTNPYTHTTWRLAQSLAAAAREADALWPNRSHASDGSVGDLRHWNQGRPTAENGYRGSDHNPDDRGIVCALDLTHDPAHGVDRWVIANEIKERRDPRVQYLVTMDPHIGHDRIWNIDSDAEGWRLNTADGGYAHENHLHISIRHTVAADGDLSPWFGASVPAAASTQTPKLEEGDPMVFAIVEGTTALYITNGLTRRHVGSNEVDWLDVALAKNTKDAPVRLTQAQMDRIPVVGK